MSEEAYFCLVTWPDGTEGLLFPRPGNVPINKTKEDGIKDFNTAVRDFDQFVALNPKFASTKIRLIRFVRMEVVQEFPAPVPPPEPAQSLVDEMYKCSNCGRHLTHTRNLGYICEYCAGIED